ncbi:exopolyphosphatase-like protein [Nemania sp. FL0916]|nr:exopolyphosphatase-like protein [Nemania sp. FL0916]
MPPRASLKTFLATARAALTAPASKRAAPLTFVVGNESADLDSLCSALLLAYFHTYAPPPSGKKHSVAGTLHIPICNLSRADLALRPEFAAVLRDAEVHGDDVLTLEDVPEEATDWDWLLVDHNAMTGDLGKRFAARVVGCVDHHADEHVVPADAKLRVIEPCGSCASLVLEHCGEVWAALRAENNSSAAEAEIDGTDASASVSVRKIDAQLSRLALAPILIDTTNLRDSAKTTPRDTAAVAFAEAQISAYEQHHPNDDDNDGDGEGEGGEKGYDRDAFFARIAALKEDISEMSLRDVLRKDYKEWWIPSSSSTSTSSSTSSPSPINLGLGTSSVPQGFEYLLQNKADGDRKVLWNALENWGKEKDGEEGKRLDLVVLLTTFHDAQGRFSRELLVYARGDQGVRAAELFEERCGEELGLGRWDEGALDSSPSKDGSDRSGGGSDNDVWCRCWTQRAVQHSRKQIAPMLRDALAEVAGRRG